MKKRRKTRAKNTAPSSLRMGVLITVLTLIVAAAAALMVPAFNVTEVYCEGNVNLKTEEILSAAQLETGKNILLSNIGGARRRVEKFPIVERAQMRRVFPDKICITVTERVPAGYITRGAECIVVATDGTVLEVITDGRAAELIEKNTPEPEQHSEEKTNEETSSKAEETSEDAQSEEQTEPTETEEELYSVPLIVGIEVKAADAGEEIKSEDEAKLNKLMELCSAMSDAHILGRMTYIDISDIEDIRIMLENRLDIYIGNADNIAYRARFLAEVITSSISPYEHVIIDYRGDDVYVRAPEDGKDRTVRKEEDEEATEGQDGEGADEALEEEETEEEDTNIANEIQM